MLEYDGFDERVRQLTGGRGVDVVYDGVGRTTYERSLSALRKRGLLALFGAVGNDDPRVLRGRQSLASALF